MIADALVVVGGYLLGSIPFGYVLPRIVRGEDIRRQGSGNVGASNVWRVYGRSLGIPVALLDVAKGFVPALVGLELGGDWVGVLAGAAAMEEQERRAFAGVVVRDLDAVDVEPCHRPSVPGPSAKDA